MLTKEFRIPLPLTTDEFQRGQRYANHWTNARALEGGEEGGEVLETNAWFHDQYGAGTYTCTLYRVGQRLPSWVNRMLPSSAMVLEERTYLAYPYIRSVVTCPFFSKFRIEVLSLHVDDDGSKNNVFDLTAAELKQREVQHIDIAFDEVSEKDYKEELDPKLFSSKDGRGPLGGGWQTTAKPLMCCYKLVRAEAEYWGIQGRAEKLCAKGLGEVFLNTHKNAFCLIDEWLPLSLEQVLMLELGAHAKQKGVSVESLTGSDGGKQDEGGIMANAVVVESDAPREDKAAAAAAADDDNDKDEGENAPVVVEHADAVGSPTARSSLSDGAETMVSAVGTVRTAGGKEASVGGDKKKKADEDETTDDTTDEDDDEDQDDDFFEAYEEWGSADYSYDPHNSPADLIAAGGAGAGERPTCGICKVRQNVCSSDLICLTCDESFCMTHFEEWHCTPKLRHHETKSTSAESALTVVAEPGLNHNIPPHISTEHLDAIGVGMAAFLKIREVYITGMTNLTGTFDPTDLSGLQQYVDFAGVVHRLQNIDVSSMSHDARLTFFINIYNTLILHAYVAYGFPQSLFKRMGFFRKASYVFNGHSLSALEIEHGVLRACTFRPTVRGGSFLPIAPKFKNKDPRSEFALRRAEPLVSFALAVGTVSSPPLRLYTPEKLREQLEHATRTYLNENVHVEPETADKRGRIFLPKMMEWYMRDFGRNRAQVLNWLEMRLSPEKAAAVKAVRSKRALRKAVTFDNYNWNFAVRFADEK